MAERLVLLSAAQMQRVPKPMKSNGGKRAIGVGAVSVCADSQNGDEGDERGEAARESKPLPLSPAQRADSFAAIERGLVESEADQVIDWEDLDRQLCQKFGLPFPRSAMRVQFARSVSAERQPSVRLSTLKARHDRANRIIAPASAWSRPNHALFSHHERPLERYWESELARLRDEIRGMLLGMWQKR
ncbi:MAG TPA: hypothetical protein PKE31_21100 [Pseudomonadota bacterium]|nr:hypothetical protein [Pseudomonadota bacterium]